MDWDTYRNDDRQEQEQLEVMGAQIRDAMKDTAAWLGSGNLSAEEQVHFLATQEGLADLARIVERRMERRKLPKDEWEYPETVGRVLSRLDKVRQIRGHMLGIGLNRFVNDLPKELPGLKIRRVTQQPLPLPDWHEELRRARNMEDGFGFLTFGRAWDAVSILAQTNDPIDQENRINNLWRMYPEAAEKLSLPKLQASSLNHVNPAASSFVESQADRWRAFREEFGQLAREEEQIERAGPKDRLLRAYCDYKKHPEIWAEKGKPGQGLFCLLKAPETGLWIVSDGVSENFQARFRALAARASVALGCAKDTDAEDFWLHRLYLDLLENNSDQLFVASKEGGAIRRVCVASGTFCARLERNALQEFGAGGMPEQHNTQRRPTTPEAKPQSTGIIPGQFQGNRQPKGIGESTPKHTQESGNPYFPDLWSGRGRHAESSPAQNSDEIGRSVESKPTNSAASAKLRIGQNIDRLRKECGWSFEHLAEKTGIDKKAILSHRHGKHKPNPKTLKEYAQAFTKELHRPITANNLEE